MLGVAPAYGLHAKCCRVGVLTLLLRSLRFSSRKPWSTHPALQQECGWE